MRLNRIIHSLLFWAVLFVVVVAIWLFAPLVSLLGFSRKDVYCNGQKIASKILLLVSGCKIIVKGLKNIPLKKPFIVASNHQSFFDTFLILAIFPFRLIFIMDSWLFSYPFFGNNCRNAGYIEIKSKSGKDAFSAIKKSILSVKSGQSIVVFPEGERTRNNQLLEFKEGVSTIALETDAPVVPVAISGSFGVMRRGDWMLYPGVLKIMIGKPLIPDYYRQLGKNSYSEFTKEIRNSIEELLSSSNS